TGTPCNRYGRDLDLGTPPPPRAPGQNGFALFNSAPEFQLADFVYRKNQMSGGDVDELMDILAEFEGNDPPFSDHNELHRLVDAIPYGEALWRSFSVKYAGPIPEGNTPKWMLAEYDVWFRDAKELLELMLANHDFHGEIDYAVKHVTDEHGKREVCDLMSGQWAWNQSMCFDFSEFIHKIAKDPGTHGSMFVPVVLRSDKTTVLVGTGNTKFYPLYISLGNVHNNVRWVHWNTVTILAFLSIPKS
ncbi:hypothetical protein HYDPIDRAFT_54279, partial [Hydnomerulius pinastri MD-312]